MTNYREEERVAKFNTVIKEKNITMLSKKYTNAREKHLFKCNVCKTTFNKVPQLIVSQEYPCPECTKKEKARRHRENVKTKFNARFHSLGLNENFEVYEYPELIKYPAKFIHKDCGHVIKTSLQNLSRTTKGMKGVGAGCKYCSKTHTYTDEEIIEYMQEERPNYQFVRSYMGDKHHLHVVVVHMLCGKEKDMQFNFFMQGKGCKHCKVSGGEEMIAYTLNKLGVPYEQEKTFEGLILPSDRSKRIDFYLPTKGIAIEYDGAQHFKPISIWGGADYLNRNQEHDALVNTYFSRSSISLHRIPYTIKGSTLVSVIEDIVNNNNDSYKVTV